MPTGQKITDGVLVTGFNYLDEFDVSALVSTGPDVYVTKSTTFGTLKENILRSPDTLQRILIENTYINSTFSNAEDGEWTIDDDSTRFSHTLLVSVTAPLIDLRSTNTFGRLRVGDSFSVMEFYGATGGGAISVDDATEILMEHAFGARINAPIISFGQSSAQTANIRLLNQFNTEYVGIKSGNTVTSYDITIPVAQGGSGETLINNGSGILTWGMAGTGTFLPLSGGTMTGNVLFTSGYGIDTTATGGSDILNIGATNANVINYGNSSTTHNFLGVAIYELQVNSYVTDKLITLNYGGSAASGIGVGFEVEENAIITGYFKTNAARNGFSILTPAIAYKADLNLNLLSADRAYSLPNVSGTIITTGDTGTVTNTILVNSSLTIGSTNIALGATSTTLAGLTSVTSTTFVGALTGNSSTSTTLQTARTIGGVSFDGSANIVPQTIQSVNEATDTTCFPLFISASGSQSLQPLNNSGFTYNSNTNALTATTFIGALNGNASTVTTNANLTGDVTSIGNASTVVSANNILNGYATTATAAGTTTLTVTSKYQQFFTGVTTQTLVLPVVSTLTLGQAYYVVNSSTGIVTVNSSGANLVKSMGPGSSCVFTCIAITGTTAASWTADYSSAVSGSGALTSGKVPIATTGGLLVDSTISLNGGGIDITAVLTINSGIVLSSGSGSVLRTTSTTASNFAGASLRNASSTGSAGIEFGTSTTLYSQLHRFNASATNTLTADASVALASSTLLQSGLTGTEPIIFLGVPIISCTGTTAGNIGTRLSAAGLRIGLNSNLHTNATAALTLDDALNMDFGTTTGTKIGTGTTQKIGFWNATPIIQPASANQAALTNSTGGTYDGTLVDVTTAAVADPAKVNSNFTDVYTLLTEIRTSLVNSGLMKGAA